MVDVHAMGRLQRWLWWARWALGVVGALFLIEWSLLGWSDAWEILVGRKSPKLAPYPYFTWPLSVIGWLLLPAFLGAVVAYFITSRADARRAQPTTLLEQEIGARGAPLASRLRRKLIRSIPRSERTLAEVARGPGRRFAIAFVKAHEENARLADECWRACVNHLLDEAEEPERMPKRFRRSWAEESAMAILEPPANLRGSPYCAWHRAR